MRSTDLNTTSNQIQAPRVHFRCVSSVQGEKTDCIPRHFLFFFALACAFFPLILAACNTLFSLPFFFFSFGFAGLGVAESILIGEQTRLLGAESND